MDDKPVLPPAPASTNYAPLSAKNARPTRHGRLFYLGLGGLGLGLVCCLLSVVLLTLSDTLNRKAASTPTPTVLPASLPTETSLAENIPAPATRAATGSATPFTDDFSNSKSGWAVDSTDTYNASYTQPGNYVMGVIKANSYFVSLSPDSLPKPLKNVILTVRAEPIVGNTEIMAWSAATRISIIFTWQAFPATIFTLANRSTARGPI